MRALLYILIMASFFSSLFGCKPHRRNEPAEVFMTLRKGIFDLPKSGVDFGQKDRLAILMETGFEEGCSSLVAVADGSTSLYFSNGSAIIGGGQHPEGADAARAFLESSRQFDGELEPSSDHPLPKPGMTRFYIIRKDDVLTGEFQEDDLGNGRLPLSPLFHKGHDLISLIRTIEEQSKGR